MQHSQCSTREVQILLSFAHWAWHVSQLEPRQAKLLNRKGHVSLEAVSQSFSECKDVNPENKYLQDNSSSNMW